VDVFVAVTFGILLVMIVAVLLLGQYHPRSVRDVLDWKPTRSPEAEVQNELDDIDQMLAATNERRRKRGLPELTEDGIRAGVHEDLRAQEERREALMAERDLKEMLETTNAGRRRRGQPELTEEQLRAETGFEGPPADQS
jgi:hypothetical protein